MSIVRWMLALKAPGMLLGRVLLRLLREVLLLSALTMAGALWLLAVVLEFLDETLED